LPDGERDVLTGVSRRPVVFAKRGWTMLAGWKKLVRKRCNGKMLNGDHEWQATSS